MLNLVVRKVTARLRRWTTMIQARMTCKLQEIIFRWPNEDLNRLREQFSQEKYEMNAAFWWKDLGKEYPGDGMVTVKWTSRRNWVRDCVLGWSGRIFRKRRTAFQVAGKRKKKCIIKLSGSFFTCSPKPRQVLWPWNIIWGPRRLVFRSYFAAHKLTRLPHIMLYLKFSKLVNWPEITYGQPITATWSWEGRWFQSQSRTSYPKG
jgi:hypothetical protein